jgi:hypothetical protein
MLAGRAPDRAQAARLLGVSPDADPTEVKRAFRLWAVWAHPDQGGSAERFTDLCAARDLLLEPRTAARPPGSRAAEASGPSHDGAPTAPRPRKGWRQVLVHPSPLIAGLLALAYVGAVAAVLVAGPSPLLAVPAALASAAWCVAVSRAILRGGDHGHVIVTRSLAWGAVTVAQVSLAVIVGIPLIEVLPLLALPFVAVIAAVNPAAGLWRGARG